MKSKPLSLFKIIIIALFTLGMFPLNSITVEGFIDIDPTVTLTASPETTEMTSTLTAVAIDTLNNAGIEYIDIYEDGVLIGTKSCGSATSCVYTVTVTEVIPTSHIYQAEAMDIGNNLVYSQQVTVTFTGIDTDPILTIAASPETTEMVSTITAIAIDTLGNAGIEYIDIYEDGVLIGTKSCGSATTCVYTRVITEASAATHTYQAEAMDIGNNLVYSEIITVSFNGPDVDPTLILTANPTVTELSSTLVAIASDSLNNAGIEYIDLYEDGVLIGTKSCGSETSCTYARVITETSPVSHTYQAEAMDIGNNLVYSEEVIVTFLGDLADNTPPVLAGIPDLETEIFVPPIRTNLHIFAHDNEQSDEELTFEIIGQSNTGVVLCQILDNQHVDCSAPTNTGYSDITVQVSDGQYTDTDTFRITVTDDMLQDVLLSAEAGGPYTCDIGDAIILSGSATGGVPLYTYDWDMSNPVDGIFETTTNQNPAFACNAVGTYIVALRVTDSAANTAIDFATITVNTYAGPNRPPQIISNYIDTAFRGISYTYDVDAIDPDEPFGDVLTYSLDAASLARGMTINAGNGVIQWTPDSLGDFDVIVQVMDLGGLTDTQPYTITVSEPPIEVEVDHRLVVRAHIVGDDHFEPGETIRMHINVENIDSQDFRGLTITTVVQELSMRDRAGPSLLKKGDEVTENLYIEIPGDAGNGLHAIRITVSDSSSGELRRVFYREFAVV